MTIKGKPDPSEADGLFDVFLAAVCNLPVGGILVPPPKEGCHTATPKELKKLPAGSQAWHANTRGWSATGWIGHSARLGFRYCCPNV